MPAPRTPGLGSTITCFACGWIFRPEDESCPACAALKAEQSQKRRRRYSRKARGDTASRQP
jgi:hypothetical protein